MLRVTVKLGAGVGVGRHVTSEALILAHSPTVGAPRLTAPEVTETVHVEFGVPATYWEAKGMA